MLIDLLTGSTPQGSFIFRFSYGTEVPWTENQIWNWNQI